MNSASIRLLLVDDHLLFREGLKVLFESKGRFVVVGEASSGPEAVERAAEMRPDVVILDMAMPEGNGVDAISGIEAACPGSRVVVLSTFDEVRIVLEALESGARGYVLKSGAFAELDAAIDQVLSGHRYLSPSLNDEILSAYLVTRDSDSSGPIDPLRNISGKERVILRMLCEEKPPKTIAAELGISRKTVDSHKRNLMAKLGVDNDLALYKLALSVGILPGGTARCDGNGTRPRLPTDK
jgi:DNA-binding NarL/FixJ family response regulator